MRHRALVVRDAANAHHAYRARDGGHKSRVLFALEMVARTAAVTLVPLVYHKLEVAFRWGCKE